jgi:AsmA protein
MELKLALLPLLSHRIEIDQLVLIHPDILLETASNGQTNWQLIPQVPPVAPPGTQTPPASQTPAPTEARTPTYISINTVSIQDGTLAYRNDATGKVIALSLPKLQATSASPEAPLHLDADAIYNGAAFNLTADTGSLARLQNPAGTSPWPVNLTLTTAAAKLTADGSLTKPLQGKGYSLAVNGTIPDAAALTPLLHHTILPPLHDVTFAAKVADTGTGMPGFSALVLHVGPSDLSARLPGLTLEKLDINAPRLDQPMNVAAAAKVGDTPVTVAGTFGPPASLLPDARPASFPVDIKAQAAGATAAANGTIADVHAMTGITILLSAKIPDLAALSPLARRPLPALKTIALQTTLTDASGGFGRGAAVRALTLTSADGDLSGDAAISLGPRASLIAVLKSNRIDLDALETAIDQAPPARAAVPPPPPSPAAKAPPPPPGKPDNHLFSTRPIPFDLLRLADADLKLNVADLHSGGADYKAIDAHAVLANGKLNVDPFAADLPGGHLTGTFSVDAAPPAPPVHLTLHAPGVALQTILAAAHQPAYANGNLQVMANLTGTGDSPHAIAASLGGTLGLAMTGGTIDNRLLGSLLGKVMDSLNALDLVGKGGTSAVKCFALRMDARRGIGAINPLALSSSLLTMAGVGTINLGAETVALALRPQARIAGTGLVIPIAVSGPIRDPMVKVNDLRAAEANAGTVAEAVIGNATPLGIVGGLLGGDKLFNPGTTDICGPALAAARGQPVPEAARTEKSGIPNPAALLKNLFR